MIAPLCKDLSRHGVARQLGLVLATVAAILVCLPSPALAARAPAPTSDAAANAVGKAHFKKGMTYYRQARYREAITEFEAAYKAHPHGVLYFNMAQCYEKLGDIPAALRSFHEYLRKVPNAEDRSTVTQAMKNLETRLAEKGLQQVLVYSDPVGASVSIDGNASGHTPFATELRPGNHSLRIEHEGYAAKTRDFALSANASLEIDETLELALSTPPLPPPIEASAQPGAPPAPNEKESAVAPAVSDLGVKSTAPIRPRPSFGAWKYVAAGGGVACAVVAIATGAAAKSASQNLLSAQHDGATATMYRDEAVQGSRASNFFTVFSVGLFATGTTLFIVEGHF